jgi:hypothetical protein
LLIVTVSQLGLAQRVREAALGAVAAVRIAVGCALRTYRGIPFICVDVTAAAAAAAQEEDRQAPCQCVRTMGPPPEPGGQS